MSIDDMTQKLTRSSENWQLSAFKGMPASCSGQSTVVLSYAINKNIVHVTDNTRKRIQHL